MANSRQSTSTDPLESIAASVATLKISEPPLLAEARRWYALWAVMRMAPVDCPDDVVAEAAKYEAFLRGDHSEPSGSISADC